MALIASAPSAVAFVNGGNEMSVASLLSTFPAGSAYQFKYARVNDLWGSVRTIMICEQDASGYYWRPQRTDYAPAPVSMTGGSMTLTPLVTAPVINLTGTLSSAITLTPANTNVWPGATFTVSSNSVLGVFGISISGLTGGGTVPLLSGGIRTITYFSGTGWKAA
jgi:hypothetical protein